MKRSLIVFPFIILLMLGVYSAKGIDTGELFKEPVLINSTGSEVEPKVTGIGGIFFFADDPKQIKEWYGENLGLAIDDYGSPFEFRNSNRPEEINYLRWAPFKKGNKYFEPSRKEFMINYRVQNIEGLVEKLKGNGAEILDSIATYEYGKFVHLLDPEGNKIELWEPVDSVLTKLGGKTTK